jgi:hypothetical protein
MKTIRILTIAIVMVFTMQFAHAQVRIGVRIGAPYHRVVVARPYGYYHRVYYGRPYYHRYYYGPRVYRRYR